MFNLLYNIRLRIVLKKSKKTYEMCKNDIYGFISQFGSYLLLMCHSYHIYMYEDKKSQRTSAFLLLCFSFVMTIAMVFIVYDVIK